MNNQELITLLEDVSELKELLFNRGYLITDRGDLNLSEYPFWDNWSVYRVKNYDLYVHNNQHIYIAEYLDASVFLIGNAVNPFTKEYDEQAIVEKLARLIYSSQNEWMQLVNQLTGCFIVGTIRGAKLEFITDPTEMLFAAYAKIGGHFYLSSHTQLIGDLCALEKDDFTKRFEQYPYFYKYGIFFPGDRTQFSEVKRVLTNHLYQYENEVIWNRIYPTRELNECKTQQEYEELIKSVAKILQDTMFCASQKWDKPAISMTGGMDSKTTLAMANGMYSGFQYYSYITMDGDEIDANAAHEIAKAVGIQHKIYRLSNNDSDYKNIGIMRKILMHNNGGYRVNPNDVRKRVFFSNNKDFDIEIKSWVSEIGRANYYKKFGLKKMPQELSARNMTALFKIFISQRNLMKETDKYFEEFIEKSKFNSIPDGYDASDMYLWEFRYSAWGGMVITMEHSFSNEIFIPFNNRELLDLMLKAPKEKRISDEFHEDLIRYGNSIISDTGITITNWNETKNRMRLERMYFLLSSFFKRL